MSNRPCGGSGKNPDASQYLKDAWDKGVASGAGRYASMEDMIGETRRRPGDAQLPANQKCPPCACGALTPRLRQLCDTAWTYASLAH